MLNPWRLNVDTILWIEKQFEFLNAIFYQRPLFVDTKVDMDRSFMQQMDEECLRDKLSTAWGLLLPQQRELLMKVHVQRKTLTSIAHDEGVALQTIQDRLKRIYKKIIKIFK